MTQRISAPNLGAEPASAYAGDADATAGVAPDHARSALYARGISLLALVATLIGLGALARSVYHLCTDAFVAPLILSSDSELVLPSKLNLARLEGERAALRVRIEQGRLLVRATEVSAAKLSELGNALNLGLDWVEDATAESVRVGARDITALHAQRTLLRARIAEQKEHIRELGEQLAAGLVRKGDLAREQDVLQQLQVAALQNQRERLGSESELWGRQRAQRALEASRSTGLGMPEVLQHREQLIRIEVELAKSDSERVGKQAELEIATAELAKLDALIAEMKERPIFRAIASRQNVAFVPYTQLDGVAPGAEVHACALWSLFVCRRIGRVLAVLAGEVASQDPWGGVARGQYALLDLTQPEAARAKTLRVRLTGKEQSDPQRRSSAP